MGENAIVQYVHKFGSLRIYITQDGEIVVDKMKEKGEACIFVGYSTQSKVDRSYYKNVINLKWLWKNKCDEENIVIHNKARLVAKGYLQEEGIDLEESFSLVAQLEAVNIHYGIFAHKSFLSTRWTQDSFHNQSSKEEVYVKHQD
ncbi:retrovirus-related pol polyprotein from transposon TNT 1-94 [Tanacetum coccineum]|uniref:Retrovirus-related pol polyprotein from transposon TNT 1-94 n=1 Tax=Tanacetum coccineum TaxID=301880 RepID=A0ABQ5BSX4_9ASTR